MMLQQVKWHCLKMCSTIKCTESNAITAEYVKFRKHQVQLQLHIMNIIMQASEAATKVTTH
jgi:hypothetical protein